jgi:LPS O-antigen subunit length determinant protein (WzzB/FepE family)
VCRDLAGDGWFLTNIQDDEIDLLSVFETLLDGKWKILAFLMAGVVSIAAYWVVAPNPKFVAKTEIKPIRSVDAIGYRAFNELDVIGIERKDLLEMFIEELTLGSLLDDAFRDHNVLVRDDFQTDEEFEDAIATLVADVKIELVTEKRPRSTRDEGYGINPWVLEFEYNDAENWKRILSEIKAKANEATRQLLIQRFANFAIATRNSIQYEIRNLDVAIENLVADHKRQKSERIMLLEEQAEIARAMGIDKSSLFNIETGEYTLFSPDLPLYLHGYIALEGQIEHLKSRADKNSIIDGLMELRQKKRALQQDKALERVEALFAETPVMRDENFSAVIMKVEATEFIANGRRMILSVLFLCLFFGGGAIYVLITASLAARRAKTGENDDAEQAA